MPTDKCHGYTRMLQMNATIDVFYYKCANLIGSATAFYFPRTIFLCFWEKSLGFKLKYFKGPT